MENSDGSKESKEGKESKEDPDRPARPKPKPVLSSANCQRTFRTMWWSSCATRRRSPSPPSGSPRPPPPSRKRIRSTHPCQVRYRIDAVAVSDCPRRRSGRASRWRQRCRPSRIPRGLPSAGWIRSSFRAALCRSCRRRARTPRRSPRLSTGRKSVWKAYVAPRPVPAMPAGSAAGSRNFEPSQGYLMHAPNGIGAAEVWGLAGAKGKRHHDLRHRRQLESQARRSADGHPAARRHA